MIELIVSIIALIIGSFSLFLSILTIKQAKNIVMQFKGMLGGTAKGLNAALGDAEKGLISTGIANTLGIPTSITDAFTPMIQKTLHKYPIVQSLFQAAVNNPDIIKSLTSSIGTNTQNIVKTEQPQALNTQKTIKSHW